jgi:hypothetical protein
LKYASVAATGLAGGWTLGQLKQREVQVRTATTTLTATLMATETVMVTETASPKRYLNMNRDFSQGLDHWDILHKNTLPPPPPTSTWGYEIKRGEYGEIWMKNPDDRALDHVTLAQGAWSHPDLPMSALYLKDHNLRLEANVMVVQDETQPGKNSLSRVAIAFDCKKLDGSAYSSQFLFPDSIFSEYDIYRRHITWGCETKDLGVITYYIDRIPMGTWRHYNVDINDFVLRGFGNSTCGGWGNQFHDQSYLNMWYLVIENLASTTKARLRNLELYEV